MISAQTLAMLPSRFCLFNLFKHRSSAIASGTLTPEAPGFRPSVGASAKGQSPRGGIVRPTQKHTPQKISSRNLWNSLKTWGCQEIITRLMKRTKLCIVLCTFSLCVYLFICLHVGYSACSMYYLSFLFVYWFINFTNPTDLNSFFSCCFELYWRLIKKFVRAEMWAKIDFAHLYCIQYRTIVPETCTRNSRRSSQD